MLVRRLFISVIMILSLATAAFAAHTNDTADATPSAVVNNHHEHRATKEMTAGEIININTASAEELQKLKGVGAKRAEAIIKYRTENGNFTSADDLAKVKGIGHKRAEALVTQVTFK